MGYEVRIIRSAEKELDSLPGTVYTRLSKRILSLEDNPRPRGVRKLSGREEYRLRVGAYRILYIINDGNRTVTILAVGHRREVYG
ncbi:MAG: type II toxin-antitoxin system RelE/ParE family toxin [Dehalococcoidales bacterium]|nr:type II toxin-antitoxin system RelE/ParE family toxin [Dehalococcoidales bacterium]